MSRLPEMAKQHRVGAEEGDPQEQYLLATTLDALNDAESQEWMLRAAQQNHTEAMFKCAFAFVPLSFFSSFFLFFLFFPSLFSSRLSLPSLGWGCGLRRLAGRKAIS